KIAEKNKSYTTVAAMSHTQYRILRILNTLTGINFFDHFGFPSQSEFGWLLTPNKVGGGGSTVHVCWKDAHNHHQIS
ncbi:unnamed protein product, partial [Musa hybrid cultivar]